jgi:hypothetical protein
VRPLRRFALCAQPADRRTKPNKAGFPMFVIRRGEGPVAEKVFHPAAVPRMRSEWEMLQELSGFSQSFTITPTEIHEDVMRMPWLSGAMSLEEVISKDPHPELFWDIAAAGLLTLEAMELLVRDPSRDAAVHCNLNPSSILVWQNVPWIVGFEGAIVCRKRETVDHTYGNRAYFSPERMGGGIFDGRSDVWSLGLTLLELESLDGTTSHIADLRKRALVSRMLAFRRHWRPFASELLRCESAEWYEPLQNACMDLLHLKETLGGESDVFAPS